MIDDRDIYPIDSPLIAELASELKAKDVMTYNVITLYPQQKVIQAKEIMRLKKISGIPIVDNENRIEGIISIDDIIHYLEIRDLEAAISKYMTRKVVTVLEDQSIIAVLKQFKRNKYGRFPVVDKDRVLKGIITPGDILVRLLQILENHMVQQQTERTVRKVKGFENDVNIDESKAFVLNFVIEGGDVSQAGEASSNLKRTLADTGRYSPIFLRKVAVVSYEAEVNVVIHAYRGTMTVLVTPDFVKIIIVDEGPGICDIDLALEPGWSTASEHVRELGFGAGMGLYNMKRWSDELMIESIPGEGTTVTAIININ